MARIKIRPPKEVISNVIGAVIIPLLMQLELELRCGLHTVVTIDVNGLLGPRIGIEYESLQNSGAMVVRGEVRIRFRETYVEGRLLFQAEGVYENSHPDAFSGFHVKGEVLTNKDPIEVTRNGWTKRHNVWTWMGWI